MSEQITEGLFDFMEARKDTSTTLSVFLSYLETDERFVCSGGGLLGL
jgi:hypothetical protein